MHGLPSTKKLNDYSPEYLGLKLLNKVRRRLSQTYLELLFFAYVASCETETVKLRQAIKIDRS